MSWQVVGRVALAAGLLAALVGAGCTAPNPRFGGVARPEAGVPGDGGGLDTDQLDERPIGPGGDGAADEPPGPGSEVGPQVIDAAAGEVEASRPPDGGVDAGVETGGGSEAGLDGPSPTDLGPSNDTPPEVAPPAILVAYWKLDETAGLTAFDTTGRGHDGRLEGFPASGNWVATPRGGGLNFPLGVSSAGVRVGSVNDVPVAIRNLQRFTVAAWTYRVASQVRKHTSIISRQSQFLDDKDVFNLTFDGPRVLLYVYPENIDESLSAKATLTTGATGGVWLHVAGTYDGQTVRIYINGQPGDMPLSYDQALLPSPYPLFIGANKNPRSNDQPFEGILDEVVLYSEALDAAAIARIRDGDVYLR